MSPVNYFITNGLILISVAAIAYLRWRRGKTRGSKWILAYPLGIKILSAVALLLVCTGVSMTVEMVSGFVKPFVVLLSIPAACVAFVAATEVFASETSYDEYRLCRCSPWNSSITLPYSEVVRIEPSMLRSHFLIHSREGRAIRLFRWSDGAEEVLGYAQEGLDDRAAEEKRAASGQAA